MMLPATRRMVVILCVFDLFMFVSLGFVVNDDVGGGEVDGGYIEEEDC